MKNKPLIIGITGAFGSGKSTAASFLEKKGFRKIVLSSFIENEAKKSGIKKITRRLLQDIGNEWREKYGGSILAKKAIALLNKKNLLRVVIDGIRNLSEIEEFRRSYPFILLAVVSNRQIRFERLKFLKRRERLTWDLFEKLDKRDLGIGEGKTGLQVAFCIALADVFIDNNQNLSDFKNKLNLFLKNEK
ncbi:MAG: AAA family ATPase [Candidatus Levybacteria bacterium]|nr:AAA family ATPase [Candidatus Levybacteria bacterium]